MPLLFSYGTLQQNEVQLSTFGRLLEGVTDKLLGFELSTVAIEDPHVIATSGSAFHPIVRFTADHTHRIPGKVFEITDAELARADDYEVSSYRRVTANLESGRQAWVYVDATQATPPMHASSLMVSLFQFKAWANDELLSALKNSEWKSHPNELHTAIRLLNHAHVVDRIFAGNLRSQPHGCSATNTEATPALEALQGAVKQTDRWYIDYVSELTPEELREQVDFIFTDGQNGRMSREEMLAHVITHGGYHRGEVGRILLQLSIPRPREVFTGYLHETNPMRREGC